MREFDSSVSGAVFCLVKGRVLVHFLVGRAVTFEYRSAAVLSIHLDVL